VIGDFKITESVPHDLSIFANVTRLLPRRTVYDPTRSPSGFVISVA
jgi:hypothetical protein